MTSVASVPGTRAVVSSGYDSAVGMFHLDTGRVDLLGYHDHVANRVVVDRDGTRAASCSSDYSIHIWDIRARTRERILLGHADDVEDFVFVDAATGVSASRDRRILVWDLETGAIRRVLEGHEKDVLSVAVENGRIYSAGDDMTLRVWDLATGAELRVQGPFEDETDTCALDPARRRAVLGCDDGCIRVFDTADGALLATIDAHRSGIKQVAVSPTTGDILSAAYDQRIVVWDAGTFEDKVSLEQKASAWERSLSWSPDGREIVGGTFDGTVLLWDATSGKLQLEVGAVSGTEDCGGDPGNACFNDVAVGREGALALVSDDGMVRIGRLTADADHWLDRFAPRSGRILMNSVAYDDPSGLVACGAHDHTLHIFERSGADREAEVAVRLGEGPINSVRIAQHAGHVGEIFAGCYSSCIVRVSPQGEVLGAIRVHDGAVKSLRLHPRKTIGVSCGADGLLLTWSFDGELLQQHRGHAAIINDVDLAPSGERLASVSRDFSLKVYEVETGRLEHSIPIGHKSLKSVCFWDEETVFVGDYWGGIVRVDLGSESHRRRIVADNGISSLARSGEHIAACSYDGTVSLVRPDLSTVRTLRAMLQKLPAVV